MLLFHCWISPFVTNIIGNSNNSNTIMVSMYQDQNQTNIIERPLYILFIGIVMRTLGLDYLNHVIASSDHTRRHFFKIVSSAVFIQWQDCHFLDVYMHACMYLCMLLFSHLNFSNKYHSTCLSFFFFSAYWCTICNLMYISNIMFW